MASVQSVQEAVVELQDQGYCVLRKHFRTDLVEECRKAFWPRLLAHLQGAPEPNRGPHRYFLPMPFDPPCFAPQFFFDPDVLKIVRGLMDGRVVVDQWGCDVPLPGSEYQQLHVDYQRPLFPENPDLALPPYAVVVSFGLAPIAREHGPIEIAPGTHRMTRRDAFRAVETGETTLQAVTMEMGDVLLRHPWALHRGTPNTADSPRALVSLRFVRRWYADASWEVAEISRATWEALTAEQRSMLRFPVLE
jgi:Phytanoyl-CoA dioxygenase (PhyH)